MLLSTQAQDCDPPVGWLVPFPLLPVFLPAFFAAGLGEDWFSATSVVYTSIVASTVSWPKVPIPSTRRTSLRAESSAPTACGPWPYPIHLPSLVSPLRLGMGFSLSFGNSRLVLQFLLGAASTHRLLEDMSRGISSGWSGGRPRFPHLDSMRAPVHLAFELPWTLPSSPAISFDQMAAAYMWPRNYREPGDCWLYNKTR